MILFHLLMVYLVLVAPIWGYIAYRKFKKEVATNPSKRMKYYKEVIAELWILTGVFIIGVWLVGISWNDLGFRAIELSPYAYGIATGGFIALFLPVALYRFMPKYQTQIDKQFDSIREFLPVTLKEKWMWVLLSLTAGVCEELLFRAFMFYYIPEMIPTISTWWIVALSSIIFGLGHTYQGVKGVIVTSLMGVLFAKIYVLTNSIVICIIIHFLIDLRIIFMLPKEKIE